jgi:hypothetical protein
MSTQINEFWSCFLQQDFAAAQALFVSLDAGSQQAVLSELFQKSAFQSQPFMLSVLRGRIKDGQSFDDFYQSWLPTEEMSSQTTRDGQTFQQHFPIPVRVFNASNIEDSEDIITVSLSWVRDAAEEKGYWEYLQQLSQGQVKDNETRHQSIEETTDRQLLGIFRVETDDNLGSPF